MRRAVLVLIVGVWLGGCAADGQFLPSISNPISRQHLAQLGYAYSLAQKLGREYRDLYRRNPCYRGQNPTVEDFCAKRSIVVAIGDADRKASVAYNTARNLVENHPEINPIGALNAAANAIANLKTIQAQSGVQ